MCADPRAIDIDPDMSKQAQFIEQRPQFGCVTPGIGRRACAANPYPPLPPLSGFFVDPVHKREY
jgi:hypothetical protein